MTTSEDRKRLGEKLREAREYLGFSQEEVAAHLGIPRSALSLIETGGRRVDALELTRLARLYRRPVGFFTGDEIESGSMDEDLEYLARRASELSPEDRKELSRFAEFLRARELDSEG